MADTPTTASAFAPLFDRHRAEYDEWCAALQRDPEGAPGGEGERAGTVANATLWEIIDAPCASDADLVAKLHYLVEAQYRLTREAPDRFSAEWECIAEAAFRHFKMGEASR